ncbi:MAG: hypothetical protein KAJ19_03210 [Gammaproteobacteria bacterium]|nr:hypothetical protein [Gammaproteobacteria bacterium]
MASLKMGYDIMSGPSQAGTNPNLSGNLQLETAKALKYFIKIQRLSDDYWWNNTSGAFQAGAVAEADEKVFDGSFTPVGKLPAAIRRLMMKLPEEALAGITAAGTKITAYATGDTPASEGVDITLEYDLDA